MVPRSSADAGANDTIKVGAIGCCGRGTGAANQAIMVLYVSYPVSQAISDAQSIIHSRFRALPGYME